MSAKLERTRRGRTAERRVVLDAVVRAEVGEVEGVRPVVALEHRRGVVWDVEGEGGREVERLVAPSVEVAERDVASVPWENACVDYQYAALILGSLNDICVNKDECVGPGHRWREILRANKRPQIRLFHFNTPVPIETS